jgi:hypothetical protein
MNRLFVIKTLLEEGYLPIGPTQRRFSEGGDCFIDLPVEGGEARGYRGYEYEELGHEYALRVPGSLHTGVYFFPEGGSLRDTVVLLRRNEELGDA